MFARIHSALEKLRRIWNSDLTTRHQLLYLMDEVAARLGSRPAGIRTHMLRDGSLVHLRRNSTDRKVFDEVFLERIYDPFARQLSPDSAPAILVDLGANIGLSAIALTRSLKLCQIVAVEPDLENFLALRRNLEQFGPGSKRGSPAWRAVQAFAGGQRAFAQVVDSGNGAWGLRMGATTAAAGDKARVPVLPLQDLIPPASTSAKTIVKCDIEGAESGVFEHILDWDHLVDFVILELHTEFFTAQQLRATLEGSHYHWAIHGDLKDNALLAVIGLERQSARATNEVSDPNSLARSAYPSTA